MDSDYDCQYEDDNEDSQEVAKRLLPISLLHKEGVWTLDAGENGKFSFKGSHEEVRNLLMRMKAKDSDTHPNSNKGRTYGEMITKAKSSGRYPVWTWKSKIPTDLTMVKELMKK